MKKTHPEGFSLVEVVVAMGVFVVAGLGLVGLLGIGLKNSNDSNEQIQAASIAEMICSTLRAAPETDLMGSGSVNPNFPIPPLNTTGNATAGTVFLTADGTQVPSATSPGASFALIYKIYTTFYPIPAGITSQPTTGVATLYLCFYWPAQATATSNKGQYELTSTFALP